MVGIRIRDLTEDRFLSFDLKELLAALGEPALGSRWRCTDLWCIPMDSSDESELAAQYDCGDFIAGAELARLAAVTRQVVDGEFRAYRGSETLPWLVVRAVDSTFWEVFCEDAAILQRLRQRFSDVEDLADDAA